MTITNGAGTEVVQGDLKNFSIFDITHALMMNRKSARVTIERNNKRGYIHFEGGQIVAALDDDLNTGEKAAYNIFFWRGGRFRMDFDAPAPERNVTLDTENLLLEIARNMDEKQRDNLIEDDDSDASAALEEHFEDRFRRELNNVFAQVASSTNPSRELYTVHAFDALLVALNDLSGSALFLRPNARPRVKTKDGFMTIKQEIVNASEIDGFVSALLSPAEMEAFRNDREITVYYTTEQAGSFSVRAIYDYGRPACIFSPASRSIPPLSHLGGEASHLAAVFGNERGLCLVAGPLAGGKTTVLASLLDHALAKHDCLISLFSKAQTYQFGTESGFIIQGDASRFSLSARGTLQAAIDQGSDVIAVDEITDAQMFEDAVSIAARTSLVIACIETEDLEDLADRLESFTRGPHGEKTLRRFGAAAHSIVEVDLRGEGERGMPRLRSFDVTDDMRPALVRGDFRSLLSAR